MLLFQNSSRGRRDDTSLSLVFIPAAVADSRVRFFFIRRPRRKICFLLVCTHLFFFVDFFGHENKTFRVFFCFFERDTRCILLFAIVLSTVFKYKYYVVDSAGRGDERHERRAELWP